MKGLPVGCLNPDRGILSVTEIFRQKRDAERALRYVLVRHHAGRLIAIQPKAA